MKEKHYGLIACLSSRNWYSFAPLLASLENSSIFEKYDAFILKKRTDSAIRKIINQYDKTVFAYSFYTHEALKIATEIQKVKANFPSEKIILMAGGPHPSGNPHLTLQLGFDVVVRGEGELIFPLLLNNIWNGQKYRNLNSVCFQENNQINIPNISPLINLDEYSTFSGKFALYPPIEITRGCPFGCKYCEVSYLFGRIIRHRSITAILRIVEAYKNNFARRQRITDIRFLSPNSLAYGSSDGKSPDLVKIRELLKSVYNLGDVRIFFATFPSETRPDFIKTAILEEIIPFIANKHIAFGAQSGSDRILKLIGRQHTVEDSRNAITTILDVNLIPIVDFIIGLPGEEVEDQYLTLELIKEFIKKKAEIRIHYFMPLAGTPFEKLHPTPIAPAVFSELGRIAKKGHLKGNLYTQIKNSQQIVKFLEES